MMPTRLRTARPVLLVVAAAAVLGALFAWRVLPGLPYDEPSHWSVVRLMGARHELLTLGDPGVSYEAQQGPVAYVLAAILAGIVRLFGGGDDAAFHAVRVLGGVELLAAVAVAARLLARLTSDRVAALAALAYFALAPIMLAIGWSVQNDALFLLLGFAALELTLRWGRGMNERRWLCLGLLVGLALLTKLSAFPLVAAIPLWLVLDRGRRRRWVRPVAAFLLGAALACGWWFIRNLVVYSRLLPPTDRGGGPTFPAAGFHGVHTVTHLFETAVAYLWVPTEYYRNQISMSAPAKGLIAVLTVAIVVLAAFGARRAFRSDAWTLLLLTAVISIGAWLVTYIAVSSVAPRYAYLALPAWLGLIALAVSTVRRRFSRVGIARVVAAAVPAAVALGLAVWVLYAILDLHSAPYEIHFPG
jgi:4-amino-4-deoxy-L-arabinose transferase-like glycosyltransferase